MSTIRPVIFGKAWSFFSDISPPLSASPKFDPPLAARRGIEDRPRVTWGQWGLAVVLFLTGPFLGHAQTPDAAAPNTSTELQRLFFPEKNFTFYLPEGQWSRIDEKKVNQLASLCLRRNEPESFFMIISEELTKSDASLEQMARAAATNLKQSAQAVIVGVAPHAVRDMKGMRLLATASIHGTPHLYVQWLIRSEGQIFQMIYWRPSHAVDLAQAGSEADLLFQRFSIIDWLRPSKNRALVPGKAEIRSDDFGFSLRFAREGWAEWKTVTHSFPNASAGAIYRDQGTLNVTALLLPKERVNLDALVDAMLEIHFSNGREFQKLHVEDVKVRDLEARVIEYELTSKSSRTYRHRLCFILGAKYGYLVHMLAKTTAEDREEMFADAMAALTIDESSATTVAIGVLPPPAKERHGFTYNRLAHFYFHRRETLRAYHLYKQTWEVLPGDAVSLRNLAVACVELGAYKKGLEILEENIERFPRTPSLLAQRGILKHKLGMVDESIADFREAFLNVYADPIELQYYCDVLANADRVGEAIELTRRVLSHTENLQIRVTHYAMQARNGDVDGAVQRLETLRKTHPKDGGVAKSLIEVLRTARRHREVVKLCDQMIAQGHDSTSTLIERGKAELEIGWRDKAEATFLAARQLQPNNDEIKNLLTRVAEMSVPSADETPRGILADHESAGFTLRLNNKAWRPWAEMPQRNQLVNVAGVRERDVAAFIVASFFVPEHRPDVDMVIRCLGSVRGGMEAGGFTPRRQTTVVNGQKCEDFEFDEKTPSATFVHRVRVFAAKNQYVLVDVWVDRKESSRSNIIAEVLGAVTFHATAIDQRPPRERSQIERLRLGVAYNQLGIAYHQASAWPEALRYFQLAVDMDGSQPTLFGNLLRTYADAGNHVDGLALANARMAAYPADPRLFAARALLHLGVGNKQAAIEDYRQAFSTRFDEEEHLRVYVALLVEAGDFTHALHVTRLAIAWNDSLVKQLLLADLHRRAGEYDQALAMLDQLGRTFKNHEIAVLKLRTLADAARHAAVIEACEKMIADGFHSALVHDFKARAQLELKNYSEAKTSWEAALKLDPSSEEIKAAIALVSGLLGQGINASIKDPLDAVELPAWLANLPVVEPDHGEDDGAAYPRSVRAIRYRKGKELATTDYETIKILTREGAQSLATVRFSFNPLIEQIFVNKAEVLDPEGKTAWVGNVEEFFVVDDTSSGMATHDKVLNIPISGLEPGGRLELVVTRRDLGAPASARWMEVELEAYVPTGRRAVVISGDVDQLAIRATATLQARREKESIAYVVENLPRHHLEPMQPQDFAVGGRVCLTDASANWKEEVAGYLASIADRMIPAPSVEELARRLVAGTTDPGERVNALSNYVQREITYRAIEFGRRGRVPNSAEEVLTKRYGDCKDHSLLLWQLLAAVDLPAHLVLVNTRGRVRKELPSIGQFDHVIVFVPDASGGRFIDCTSKDYDLAVGPPFGLAGKEVLVLDGDNSRFLPVPAYPRDSNAIRVTREVALADDVDAVVGEKVEIAGYFAGYFRGLLRGSDRNARLLILRGHFLGSVASAEFQKVDVENLDDISKPLVLRLVYHLPGRFHDTGDQLVGRLPGVWERKYFACNLPTERKTPFELYAPLRIQSESHFVIPSGFFPSGAASGAEESKDAAFAQWTVRRSAGPKDLRFAAAASQTAGVFPRENFVRFKQEMRQMLDRLEPSITLIRSAEDSGPAEGAEPTSKSSP